jgi:hydroxymethylglutaryl-CoA lyase
MSGEVKIIECPRDAWQSLPKTMPAEVKADYLRMLIGAGFQHIDAVSFVSPAVVPQMADSEKVLEYLDPPDDVEIIGIVVNEKGAERAIETGVVQTLGFPYSISPEFLRRNQKQTPGQAGGSGTSSLQSGPGRGGVRFDGVRQSLRRRVGPRRGACGV